MGWRKMGRNWDGKAPLPGHTQQMFWDPGQGDDQGVTWKREPLRDKRYPTGTLKLGTTELVTAG